MPRLRDLRRSLAFLLVGLADELYPAPSIGTLANPALDAHLAGRRAARAACPTTRAEFVARLIDAGDAVRCFIPPTCRPPR